MVTKFTWRPRGPRFQPQLGQKSGCMFHFELGLGVLNPGLDTILKAVHPGHVFPNLS